MANNDSHPTPLFDGQTDASALLSDQREAFQTVQIDGATVILSVRPNETLGVTNGIGSDWSDVAGFYLYAEQVTLAGSTRLSRTMCNAHGSAVCPATTNVVATHTLSIIDSMAFDVSGQDGPLPNGVNEGTTPIQPYDGGVGGNRSLYVERLTPQTASIAITATGGAGSPGQQGAAGRPGGAGGDGGAGGQVNMLIV
ncbi:MAG: hypothetical protein ABL894_04800, partial [Hyphomicrobium sp.]